MDEQLWKVLKNTDADWEKDEQIQKAIRQSEELEWETVRLWVKYQEMLVEIIGLGREGLANFPALENADKAERNALLVIMMPEDTYQALRKAAEGSKQAVKMRSVAGVMDNTMAFFELMGSWDYQDLLAAAQKQRDGGAAGGKLNALSDAEKAQKFHAWDRAIRKYGGKKSLAMKRLGISRSLYYRYRKIAQKILTFVSTEDS